MSGVSTLAIVILLSLQTICNCLQSTIGQYIYSYYLSIYSNETNRTFEKMLHSIKTNCQNENFTSNNSAQLWAEQRSANLTFRINLVSSGPVIISTYVLGLYTSKLGKRIVLLLPIIGSICQMSIWLAIIYLRFDEFLWYIAAFIVGLSGSSGVFGLTMNLIITENTIENERSSRFVRLNASQTALAALISLSIGYYISFRGFTDLYWTALVLQILSIIIVCLVFKSVDIDQDERRPLLATENTTIVSSKCEEFFKIFTVFRLTNRSKKKNLSLYLTLCSNLFYVIAVTCFAPFLWLLLSAPFCWTSKDIGNYSAISAISSAILSLLGMQIFTYFQMNDALICVISHLCFCATCLWIAFAHLSWQLYVNLLINAFANYQGSLTTSMISKWLQIHERNYAFTFVTEINTIISALGNSFFNWVYAKTVVYQRTLTLFIAAGLSSIPFILNICLFIITRTMSEDEIPLHSQSNIEPTLVQIPINVLTDAGLADCMMISSRSLTSSTEENQLIL